MKKLSLVLCFLFIFTGCFFDKDQSKSNSTSNDSANEIPATVGAPSGQATSNIVLNKYYVDARESTPRLEKEIYEDELGSVHNSIPTPYLKFLNNEEVELNYACTGEDMCVTKTTYSTYQENNVTYIKLYENSDEDLYFLCSEEGSGYALLKVNGNTLSVISKERGFFGLDLTDTSDYKLYEG